MLVASVQKYERLIDSSYKPSLLKSSFACEDSVYMKGYKVMLDKLSCVTNKPYILGIDSCYWFWVENPFFELYAFRSGSYYVCVYDINEQDAVLSDYDKWSNSLNIGNIPLEDCFNYKLDSNSCIQGVSWDLPWSSMVCAIPIKKTYGLSVEEVVKLSYLYDAKSVLEYERLNAIKNSPDLINVAKEYCKSVLDYLDVVKFGLNKGVLR